MPLRTHMPNLRRPTQPTLCCLRLARLRLCRAAPRLSLSLGPQQPLTRKLVQRIHRAGALFPPASQPTREMMALLERASAEPPRLKPDSGFTARPLPPRGAQAGCHPPPEQGSERSCKLRDLCLSISSGVYPAAGRPSYSSCLPQADPPASKRAACAVAGHSRHETAPCPVTACAEPRTDSVRGVAHRYR